MNRSIMLTLCALAAFGCAAAGAPEDDLGVDGDSLLGAVSFVVQNGRWHDKATQLEFTAAGPQTTPSGLFCPPRFEGGVPDLAIRRGEWAAPAGGNGLCVYVGAAYGCGVEATFTEGASETIRASMSLSTPLLNYSESVSATITASASTGLLGSELCEENRAYVCFPHARFTLYECRNSRSHRTGFMVRSALGERSGFLTERVVDSSCWSGCAGEPTFEPPRVNGQILTMGEMEQDPEREPPPPMCAERGSRCKGGAGDNPQPDIAPLCCDGLSCDFSGARRSNNYTGLCR